MKEPLSPIPIMEKMVEKLNQSYPDHPEKAEGIIQFHLIHEKEEIDCYITSDYHSLSLVQGIAKKPTVTVKSTFYNWLDLAGGRLNPIIGVITRKLKFKGDTSFFKILPRKPKKPIDVPKDPVTKFERNPNKHWTKPKKVIILNASPRGENGYTDFYLKPFIKGVSQETTVETEHLAKYHIKPCTGCFSCWMNVPGRCVYHDQDDFHKLAEKMFTADLTVYAFPIYADGMPGILKNYFDRSVSRAYPYMIQGMSRVRHPRRYINKQHTMAVFSICGFFEKVNFNPVKAYFKALAHNRHTPVIAQIYRTTAVGLYGNPFLFKKLNKIMDSLEAAGVQLVTKGKIKRKTLQTITQNVPSQSKDLHSINAWWNEKKGSKDYNY